MAHLLQTKLFIPPSRATIIGRERLIEKMNQGLRHGGPLTLISAPAGYGKSILAAQWLRGLSLDQSIHGAWLSLDDKDNDPVVFFSYIAAALGLDEAGIRLNIHRMLEASVPDVYTFMSYVINEIYPVMKKSSTATLTEPLTLQELKVLQLLSVGLSNQGIADELVISLGTAKWHVHNLYEKLEVKSRTQAISRAQELGLLS